jgi:PTS system nitrogen regulatory IIA component
MTTIDKYFREELISFFTASSRDDAIKKLVKLCEDEKRVSENDHFFEKIQEREKIVSTGIGMGVAVPHAKMSGFDEFFIAVGVLQKGVDWNALDEQPVRLVFLIGGPDDKQTEYLQILSSLTTVIKDEHLRKKLLTSNSPLAIIGLFKTI